MEKNDDRAAFIQSLNNIYSAELQVVSILPKLKDAAGPADVKIAIDEHIIQTGYNIHQLKQIFHSIGEKAGQGKCDVMELLIDEADKLLNETPADSTIRDEAIIEVVQKIARYEASAYKELIPTGHSFPDAKEQTVDENNSYLI